MAEYLGCTIEKFKSGRIKFLQKVLLKSYRDEFDIKDLKKFNTLVTPGTVSKKPIDGYVLLELKDSATFFHKVFARDLLERLEKNSTGLHALDIIALRSNNFSSTKMLRACLTSSWPWKKRIRKQSALSSPFLTLNWPSMPPPMFSNQETTRRKWTNGKDKVLP
jgi:hypothetical protein